MLWLSTSSISLSFRRTCSWRFQTNVRLSSITYPIFPCGSQLLIGSSTLTLHNFTVCRFWHFFRSIANDLKPQAPRGPLSCLLQCSLISLQPYPPGNPVHTQINSSILGKSRWRSTSTGGSNSSNTSLNSNLFRDIKGVDNLDQGPLRVRFDIVSLTNSEHLTDKLNRSSVENVVLNWQLHPSSPSSSRPVTWSLRYVWITSLIFSSFPRMKTSPFHRDFRAAKSLNRFETWAKENHVDTYSKQPHLS